MINVSIIGTGLIGSSIGLSLRRQGYIVAGYDNSIANLNIAKNIGAVDTVHYSVLDAVENAQIIILTAPVNIIIKLLPQILDISKEDCVVIDAGSTKAGICESVAMHPKRHAFVAVHPMAGSEQSGPAMAKSDLFHNKTVVICEQELSSEHALKTTESLLSDLGMRKVYLSPVEHDMAVALISHLPQTVAYCFASMNEFQNNNSWQQLASGGFESASRLALSNPEVWLPILLQNKDFVIKSIMSMCRSLVDFADKLEKDNWDGLIDTIQNASNVRRKFNTNNEDISVNKTETKKADNKINDEPTTIHYHVEE